ncbi:phosphoglycolate phosphatase [Anaerolineales bacterium]|nr:phosphoglycolate phosphatase [Anaerolineales bacterium]
MNTKPFDLVIFDCDGVLVDSERIDYIVLEQIMREHGYVLEEKSLLENYPGMAFPERIAAMSRDLNWTPPTRFFDIFSEYLVSVSEKELKAVPGIHDLLESLSVPICIASNGTRDEVTMRLRIAGLTDYFNGAIFSGLDVPNPKPAPDVYLAAAQAFHVPPSRCVVVEDTVLGVTAAVRAGMKVYGHAAFTSAESLRRAGAIPFGNMMELRTFLNNGHKALENHGDGSRFLSAI